MIKRFILLLAIISTMSTISCEDMDLPGVEITNNSEYDITWVVIIRRGYADTNERKIIAKNGGSRWFDVAMGTELIVCVKAENTPELMCVDEFELKDEETKAFVWNGSGDSVWQAK